jgi:hypothetical protein
MPFTRLKCEHATPGVIQSGDSQRRDSQLIDELDLVDRVLTNCETAGGAHPGEDRSTQNEELRCTAS